MRLTDNAQIKAVMSRRLRFSDDLLTLYVAENDCGYPRLGISIGKTYGKAVVRNRFKRLMREAFRRNQGQIPSNLDYLLMVSPRCSDKSEGEGRALKDVTFEEVNASFVALVGRARRKVP
jgi:ribonuclease P protein component